MPICSVVLLKLFDYIIYFIRIYTTNIIAHCIVFIHDIIAF